MKKKRYYLGLDIGTDSVGYAATDEQYRLCKFRGEPVWGTTLFEAANLAGERRSARVARRRLDRRQQRAALLEELFAPEIGKIDPNFFLRRRESALFIEDAQAGVKLFDGGITDEEYHRRYPTIHHLIAELMTSREAHDVRLVYMACAWLVTHRGHFLFDMANQVSDFGAAYGGLCDYLSEESQCALPRDTAPSADTLLEIMTAQAGVKRKQAMFTELVFGGKKPSKKPDEAFPYSRDGIVTLLCGGTVKPKELFAREKYAEIESVRLGMDEENFARILSELDDDDGELLRALRRVYDCALLTQTLGGCAYISEAKVAVYDQHKRDLAYLKQFVRKYTPENYALIFRTEATENYVAYSGNVRSCKLPQEVKRVKKEAFSNFLLKILKGLPVEEADREAYEDMLERLRQYTFLQAA